MSDELEYTPPAPDDAAQASDAAPPDAVAGPAEIAFLDAGTARYSNTQIRRGRDLLARLYAVRRAAKFYSLDHPATDEAVSALLDTAHAFHEEGVDVHFAFFEGEIYMGEQVLTEESVLFDQLVRDMESIGAGSLTITRGVDRAEMLRAMEILAADAFEIDRAGGLQARVGDLDLSHVIIGEIHAVERPTSGDGDTVEEARQSYSSAVSLVREIDRLLRINRHVSPNKIKGVVRSLVDNVTTNNNAMLQLTGLKNYDEYTFYHSANVAILSVALGSMVSTDYRFLSSLGVGALLHDLGKLAVEAEILNKPGALDPDEWERMRQHPVHGAEMVATLPGVDKSAVVTILEHHMRYDGSGYPQRSPKRPQHLSSRIVAVADSYDAMTSRRSYSAARVQDEAMALLVKSGGTSLDPALVRLFVRLLGVYPPRSVVRMSAGEIGIVLRPSPKDPLRPVVRVIAAPSGELMEPADVDLTEASDVSIRGCIDPRLVNIEVDDYI